MPTPEHLRLCPRERALRLIAKFPDDVGWRKILYHLSVCEQLHASERDEEEGRVIADEDLDWDSREIRPLPSTPRERAARLVTDLPSMCSWEKLIYELWRSKELEEAIEADLRRGGRSNPGPEDLEVDNAALDHLADRHGASVGEIETAILRLEQALSAMKGLALPAESDPLHEDVFDQEGRALYFAEQAKMYLENVRDCVKHSLPLQELRHREQEQQL